MKYPPRQLTVALFSPDRGACALTVCTVRWTTNTSLTVSCWPVWDSAARTQSPAMLHSYCTAPVARSRPSVLQGNRASFNSKL